MTQTKTDRELDCELAELFGGKVEQICPGANLTMVVKFPRAENSIVVPNYSTDLSAVWEAAREAGWRISEAGDDGEMSWFTVRKYRADGARIEADAEAETPAKALTLSLIEALKESRK